MQNDEICSWVDQTTGLDCLILRIPCWGHLCGYVRVPESNRLYGKNYLEEIDIPGSETRQAIDRVIECHGDVTFSGELPGYDGFWFGFDCNHFGDLAPLDKYQDANSVYRDEGYVTRECEKMARSIIEIGNEK